MISQDTLRHLEFDKILTAIAAYAHSDVTAEQITATAPLADEAAIGLISGRIREIRALTSLGITLRISRFHNIRPQLDAVRPAGAFLSPADLLLFIPLLENFRDISRQFGSRQDIPLLNAFEYPLQPFSDILEPLSASIDHEGNIMDSASAQLKEIRRAKRSLAARIRKKLEEIVRDNQIDIFLQDDFITQRSGRWVIPVRMDSKGMVKGVVHDVSTSGETAFMEPLEIIPFVNELENLTADEKAEEIRILRQLSVWIREDTAELANCLQTLVELDRLNSIAVYAEHYDLEPAKLNGNGMIRACGARHPLLLMLKQHQQDNVEPLNLQLGGPQAGEASVMVITGPNAGGKTIALKTAGILTLMALCGMPVPADGEQSTFPLLDNLLVDIGDEQSIEQSLSTFSAHVARIAAILEKAGSRSMVLLDELGAGTEPQQGAAIACGVLRVLQERGAIIIATTHLSDIIGYVHRTPGMINAGMEYDAENYRPLYRLIIGEPGHSHALDIARRFGMPEQVISQAREMLGSAGSDFTSMLADLRRKRAELDEQQHLMDRQRQQLDAHRLEVEARAAGIEQARREAAEKAWAEAKELISVTRRRMNELLDEYKREKRADTLEKLKRSETEFNEQIEAFTPAAAQTTPLKAVKCGDSVFVGSIGHNATVINIDERHGKARVRAGSMELDVLLKELSTPLGKSQPKQKPSSTGKWQVSSPESDERELKLIGLRAEEAIDMLEPFLNHAALSGIGEVRIIHGLGTGKLRQAVRDYLTSSRLVESFRPGEAHEGRDGATVVKIRN